MKGTDVLERCRSGDADVQRLRMRIARLERCGADPSMTEVDIEACRRELDKRERQLDAERLAACRIVNMLPGMECSILFRYYVSGQSQGGITSALHIDAGYYKRKKRDGLAIVRQMDDALVDAQLPEWYLRE